jgi:AmmeMemoRadiSam system protein B/AmmeMemoRadiSam system protein A
MNLTINRKPAVSGKFYPAKADALIKTLKECFGKVENNDTYPELRAIIAPHAGYIYSGEVAASAYSKIDRYKEYETIFILAPSHHTQFNGGSIYNIGNYETPLGEVIVNRTISNELMQKSSLFNFYREAHKNEHSIEVQLPFLQYWLKHNFTIVPILIGTNDIVILKKLADELLPYFNKKNLIVISSDFSHFPNYNDAIVADHRIANAILTKKISDLQIAVEQNKKANITNLVTSACGLSGILMLLHLIENQNIYNITKIKYTNSGDTQHGDHSRVVGYLSFVVTRDTIKNERITLTDKDKSILLESARQAIKNKLNSKKSEIIDKIHLSETLKNCCGLFVSLHKQGELRGCVGRFESKEPLFKLCQQIALAAAFSDTRFPALTLEELNDISIEISVLSPFKRIHHIDEIKLGTHGIYIKQGYNKGTLLPQVATHNNWNVEEFLGYCAKNKAGIGWEGWKTAELFTYTATVFSE